MDKTDAHVVLTLVQLIYVVYVKAICLAGHIYVNVLREQFGKVNGQLNKEELEQREKL